MACHISILTYQKNLQKRWYTNSHTPTPPPPTHYNNIKNNNTNNNVVSLEKESNVAPNETNTILEAKKELLAQVTAAHKIAIQAHAKLYASPNCANNLGYERKQEILQKLETIGALDTQKIVLETEIAHLEQNLAQEKTNNGMQSKLTTDPHFVANSPGNRTIKPSQYTRLSNTISSYCVDFEEKNRLINEILFDCRFGSLIKNNITNQEMPLERSINIALKLVREKRWNTPPVMQQQFQVLVNANAMS